MNSLNRSCIGLVLITLIALQSCFAQVFVNLDFESANVAGYSPGNTIPITNAFPGWAAFFYTSTTTNTPLQVYYDAISTGSAEATVVDKNAPASFGPLQGSYSAYLFGSFGYYVGLSQSGVVPNNAESLLIDISSFYDFIISVNGKALSMTPLSNNSFYTVYGADISAFAGQTATLNLIAPPTANPNGVEFDNIQFSSTPVPEPSDLALLVLGGLFLVLPRRRNEVV